MRIILLAILSLGLVSCASYFKRKDCEKKNWYNHGHSVAMSGKRLNEDNELRSCEKVEAEINYQELDLGFKSGMGNYCKEDTVLQTGKSGKKFNSSLCDSGKASRLKKIHQKGVRIFCRSKNGYKFGASGVKYNGICPEDLEDKFLSRYKKGRKKYLLGKISDTEMTINMKKNRVAQLNNEMTAVQNRLNYMRSRQVSVSVGGQTVEVKDGSKEQAERLTNELNSKSYEVNRLIKEQNKLLKEIQDYRVELRSLEEE